MLTTPAATPARSFGAEAMMAALLAGVKRPRPVPTSARPTRSMACPGFDAARTARVVVTTTMPVTVRARPPDRSDKRPAKRAARARKSGITVSSSPARPGSTRSPCSKKNGVTTSTPNNTRYDASPPATPVEKAG